MKNVPGMHRGCVLKKNMQEGSITMFREFADITETNYDPSASRIPELIGKHPGADVEFKTFEPNPLQFVKPASASRVSGMMEVELKIRDGNQELEKNIKKVILTIDGRQFEFDQPPYMVRFDTSHARYRLIKLQAEAIGEKDGQAKEVLATFYTNVIAENGKFDKSKPLILFAGVLEPPIENARGTWTPDMCRTAYTYSENMLNHLMHYGLVPDFLKEVDQFTVLFDPTQLDKGMSEYKPAKLIDVLGRETGPGCEGQTYTDMIPAAQWIDAMQTPTGMTLMGYHIPEACLPNGMPDIYEVFAARVMKCYWKFDPAGVRAWEQARNLFKDIMADLRSCGYDLPWEAHSTLIGKKPTHLKDLIKKQLAENNITGIVLSDLLTEVLDFDGTKGIWEDVQEAIDLVEQETGRKLPLSIACTTGGAMNGSHPDFAESALRMTENEITTAGIPNSAKVGLILCEHGYPPGLVDEDIGGSNLTEIRRNIQQAYHKALPALRGGRTEYRFGMNSFNSHPGSGQMSTMEWLVDYLHRGFDTVILQPYYFPNETFELFDDFRHEAFDIAGIDDEQELRQGFEILENYRTDFTFRGARIIMTGSLLGRYEKDGHLPLIQEAYSLYKNCLTDAVMQKLRSL